MSTTQEEVALSRDVTATLIPHGEDFTLSKGEKVTITHRLGGNFTVMTLQGMYRIAAKDADALGETEGDETDSSKQRPPDSAPGEPVSVEEIKERLKTVFDPEIPVNVVDLGLTYRIEIEERKEDVRKVHSRDPTGPSLHLPPVRGWPSPSSQREPRKRKQGGRRTFVAAQHRSARCSISPRPACEMNSCQVDGESAC